MTPKPEPNPKSSARSSRKQQKGTTETARLFIDVTEVTRKTQTLPLTRYVE
jgi:hypothetical protein